MMRMDRKKSKHSFSIAGNTRSGALIMTVSPLFANTAVASTRV